MTPSAVTPAARGKAGVVAAPRPPQKSRPAGHRASLARQPTPAHPRRVSGPARGVPRPARPARAGVARAPRASAMRAGAPRLALVQRALQFLGALPESGVLDRLIRGRAWIPLLGVMLAGIVAMQVEVLKLGTTIGRSIERGAVLQSRNDVLRQSVSLLADDQRIERLATGMGMVMPAPEAISFLPVHGIDAEQVLAAIQAPDATSFTAHLPAAASPVSGGGLPGGTPGVGSGAGTTATAGAGTAAAASGASGSGTATASGSGSTSTGAGPGAGSGSGAGGGAGNGAGAGGGTGPGAGSSPGTGTAAASTGASTGTSGSAGTTAASGLTSSQSQSGGAAPSGQ